MTNNNTDTKFDEYPILQFDPSKPAVIEPSEIVKPVSNTDRCVICFFGDVIRNLPDEYHCTEQVHLKTMVHLHPVYELDCNGEKVSVFLPGVGAPLAVALTEEMIARGCRKFIACGTSGVLDSELARGKIFVPTSAVRDEGTSYHYAPPACEISPDAKAIAAIEETLNERDVPYRLGKTWTTDAFYRETPDRVRRRKAQGCLTVEMEASALFALAQFRDVSLGLILSAGDDVSGDKWDPRRQQSSSLTHQDVFKLAVEACLRL